MPHEATLLEIQQDQRDQAEEFSPLTGWVSVIALIGIILLIWGDGGWPWQRRH